MLGLGFLVDVLSSAAYCGLLALAIVFVYRANRVLLFCVGEIGALAAFLLYSLYASFLPNGSWLAWILAGTLVVLVTGLIGAALFTIIEQLGTKVDHFVGTMLTIAFALVLQGVMSLAWQGDIYRFAIPARFVRVAGERLSITALIVAGVGLLLALLAILLLGHSRIGREMQAIADNRQLSALRAIPVTRRMVAVGAIAGILAGCAGVLAAATTSVSAENAMLSVNAITAAIIGGMTSPAGAILGALVLAVIENLTTRYIDPAYATLTPVLLLAIMLLFKPYGLLGKPERISRV